jgi:hypothetical protein
MEYESIMQMRWPFHIMCEYEDADFELIGATENGDIDEYETQQVTEG